MRSDEGIRLLQQGIRDIGRFGGEHVGTEGIETPRGESIGYSLIVNERSPTRVNDNSRGRIVSALIK